MYLLTRSVSLQRWLTHEIPALGISLVIAELLYRFHSFSLECLAFLATWWVVGAALERLVPGDGR